jgi:hypothetical protein
LRLKQIIKTSFKLQNEGWFIMFQPGRQ